MSATKSFGHLAEGAPLHAPLYFADIIAHVASLPSPNFSKAHWTAESHILLHNCYFLCMGTPGLN